MAFHQDKTLKKPKVQSRSRRKPTKKKKKGPKPKSKKTYKKKEKEIQRIEANLQIYKKIKRSKAEVRDDALQKKKKNSKVQGRSRSEPTKKRKRNPVQGRSRSEPTKKEQVQGRTNRSKRSKVEANRKNLKKKKD